MNTIRKKSHVKLETSNKFSPKKNNKPSNSIIKEFSTSNTFSPENLVQSEKDFEVVTKRLMDDLLNQIESFMKEGSWTLTKPISFKINFYRATDSDKSV
jgi:hypothetical protein